MGSSLPPPIPYPRFRHRRGALGPQGIYTTPGDEFLLQVRSRGGAAWRVEARVRLFTPELQCEDYRILNEGTGSDHWQATTVPAHQGFIQGAHVVDLDRSFDPISFVAQPDPDLYATLSVGRAVGGGPGFLFGPGYTHTIICQGYLDDMSHVGWPGGSCGDGRNAVGYAHRQVSAGNFVGNLTITHGPLSGDGELVGARLVFFVAPGSVAAKFVLCRIIDGSGNEMWRTASPAALAIGGTGRYEFGQGVPYLLGAVNTYHMPIPVRCFLHRGAYVEFTTTPVPEAGDTWTDVVSFYRLWDF